MTKVLTPSISRLFLPYFISNIFFFCIFFIPSMIFLTYFSEYSLYIILGIVVLFIIILITSMVHYMSLHKIKYSYDDYFVSKKYEFISDSYTDIPLEQITNISYNVSFLFDKFFNTGSILFHTSGSSSTDLRFDGISNVENVYAELSKILKYSDSRKIDASGNFVEESNTDSKSNKNIQSSFLRRVKPDFSSAMLFSIMRTVGMSVFFFFFAFLQIIFIIISALSGTIYLFIVGFLILIGFVGFIFLAIYLDYRRFKRMYYDFYTDKLEYYDGFLSLNKATVPIERITNIDSNQNLIQRILGIYQIKIETAGTSGSEISINFVKNGDDIVSYLKEVLHKHGRN